MGLYDTFKEEVIDLIKKSLPASDSCYAYAEGVYILSALESFNDFAKGKTAKEVYNKYFILYKIN